MKTFEVSVEKRMYATGKVKVRAVTHDAAVIKVNRMIDIGELKTDAVDWGGPIYEDGSFAATDDVDYEDDDGEGS